MHTEFEGDLLFKKKEEAPANEGRGAAQRATHQTED